MSNLNKDSTSIQIRKFIDKPNPQKASEIDRYAISVLYAWSTFCIDKNIGNVEKARKVRESVIPEMQKSICLDRRGLKSLFSACKMLASTFIDMKDVSINVYSEHHKEISWHIRYNYEDMGNMFFVKQTYEPLGGLQELHFYWEGLRDYFKSTFQDDSDLRINKININIGKHEKSFYRKDLGIIWNEEKCAKCTRLKIQGKPLDKDCDKLLEKKCYLNFRYVPNIKFMLSDSKEVKQTEVRDYDTIVKEMKEKKQCQTCMSMNKKNAKQCEVCETKF